MVLFNHKTETNMEKGMMHIIDDFLFVDDYKHLDLHLKETKLCEWNYKTWEFEVKNEFVKKVLNKAAEYYDMEELGWYEAWNHTNSRPLDWHYDKHENLFGKQGILAFPICSCVYYPSMDHELIGGELMLQNKTGNRHDRIQPIPNRLVLFDPGVLHCVNAFRGKRTSININPWQYWRIISEGSIKQQYLHGSR